ncbi:hypothetical protein PYW08_008464 [Mythimna loreyi]|uniref:Uncharacterized protein n=1 Tax=Mythimna loreyi TaxID=667449 RepID=A0ACC2QBJ4_9NEOP|nr:hypothetical protein PYW08_008464 [Mythimna loreyi]
MEPQDSEKSVECKNKWLKRKYFFRQMLVSSGGWTCYFIMGMSFGASTVFIPQIRKEANSFDAVSESTASWIPAIMVYAGLPWVFILPALMKYIGRNCEVILCKMEDYELEKRAERKNKWEKRIFFFRQMMISSGGWTCYFIMGMSFGASTVFIPQIRKEANSFDAVSESTASWIPAIMVYSGLPWTFILPIFMKYIGRKYTFMFVTISNLISFLVFYLSVTVNQIIISQDMTLQEIAEWMKGNKKGPVLPEEANFLPPEKS